MTGDDTILKEVDQALAEDKASESIRKNLPAIVGAALVVVAGVGGWQVWAKQRQAAAVKASAAYAAALEETDEGKRIAALESLAGGEGGYAMVARLRLAGELAAKNEREKALSLYREVYAGSAGSKRLRDVARLRAGYLALADGRDAVLKDVGELEIDKTAIGFYARELIALAAMDAGDYQYAEEMFRKAAAAADAPESIRLRAGEFAALAGAGKAGVKFPVVEASGKSEKEIMMETLQKAGSDLSSIVAKPPAAGTPEGESAPPEGNE